MNTIVDDAVLFILPKDEELFFAAASVLQKWVNGYDMRMEANDVSGGHTKYKLLYGIDCDRYQWDVLIACGFELAQPPVTVTRPNMVIDMSDERVLALRDSKLHACQICGVLAGEEAKPLPKLKQLEVNKSGEWLDLRDNFLASVVVLDIVRGVYPKLPLGVVARASAASYLAASVGLPLIEVYPRDRPVEWLSKWQHKYYRMVIDGENVEQEIKQAKVSLMEHLLCSAQVQTVEE